MVMPALNVSFTEAELTRIRRAAAAAGLPVKRFVHTAALDRALAVTLEAGYRDMSRRLGRSEETALADRATYFAVSAMEGDL
ncbi:hypothetical protein SAMN05216371_7457 [Streptomyces sp. TLI_053]|nr:hypothetical protein SAMN05216371_7457 [Streptomyces sp. TLI_053]